MGKNEEQNIKQKIEQTNQMIEESSKLAANLASGNFIGAAKNILNLFKNKEFKKKLKRKLIMIALQAMIPIIIGICIFGIFNAVKDTMIELLSNVSTSIGGFISETWKWMTDDYWIKLDEKIDYELIDEKTGTTTTESFTIVDKYIKELETLGISLETLGLLGEADYSNNGILLEDNENKRLVEKYISEFIRADIITQQPHKRRGDDLVNPLDQDEIDGGVYFYRTKEEPKVDEKLLEEGEFPKENVEVVNKNYVQMEFMKYDEFMEKLKKNDENLRYRFTIDEESGELIVVKITKVVVTEQEIELDKGWFYNLFEWVEGLTGTTTKYELEEERIPYKEYIAKYTMPYEFLINLCEITQNPEFVYHVALLARDTKIILAIQDNTTVDVETTEIEFEHTTFTNRASSDIEGASESEPTRTMQRTVIETTVQTPVLTVEYADTWSFYEEFEYTKNVDATKEESEPKVNTYTKNDVYRGYILAGPFEGIEYVSPEASTGVVEDDAKIEVKYEYYQSTLLTKSTTMKQFITMTTTYNKAVLQDSKSVEKSKQFLGLLRNSTGKCDYGCKWDVVSEIGDPIAIYCAKHSEFDRYGEDVKYRIPNSTQEEAPMNNLLTGLDKLYAILQSNSSGYKEEDKLLSEDETSKNYDKQEEYIAEEDYESAYVVKMQGLLEHMQYLMTFPDNEVYTIKDIFLENLFGDDEIYDGEILPGYDFWWPIDSKVDYCRISSYFGKREAPTEGASSYHKGIDIAGDGQSLAGVAIIASADGVVKYSGVADGYGNVIYIDHENGFETRYAHNAQNLVNTGQKVTRGQIIGYVGNTGVSTGPHLHFEIRLNGTPVNPLNYVSIENKRPELGSVSVKNSKELDIIYAVVASECASSYEGALAVMTCVLNRCDSSTWAIYGGNDPYKQITASGQFSYGIEEYKNAHKKYLNGNAPEYVKSAVNDALKGTRNHNYTRFRTDSEKIRVSQPNGEEIGGNWYF